MGMVDPSFEVALVLELVHTVDIFHGNHTPHYVLGAGVLL